MTYPRHNPALSAYIFGWQKFIAQFTTSRSDIALFELANRDLTQALQNYHNWCMHPHISTKTYARVWSSQTASLLDCGGKGAKVLVIPSLINSHEILDLTPDRSLVDHLKENGFHVHILMWQPVQPQSTHSTNDYVTAIKNASVYLGEDFHAIGYCIGGTLLNIAAKNLPNLSSQILLGAPWNFHHDQGQIGAWASGLKHHNHLETFFDQTKALYGFMPSTMIDYFFAGLNPLQFVQKFRYANHPDPIFDALENWLTSGLDLSYPFSRELVMNWMRENALMSANITHNVSTLIVHGQRDHIAPPASCLPIMQTTSKNHIIAHPSGHVGLMIGASAKDMIWPKLVKYLQSDSAQQNFA